MAADEEPIEGGRGSSLHKSVEEIENRSSIISSMFFIKNT